MAILLTNEIMSAIADELKSAAESVQIITAYCKENAIKQLSNYIPNLVSEKKLMIRFRLDDLVKGSTDFSVLDYCRSQDWKIYIRFDLHAKTYVVDGKRGFVGSANATNTGLDLVPRGNMELSTLIDIDENDLKKIEALYDDAIYVDDNIYNKLKSQYQSIEGVYDSGKQYSWSDDIKRLFNPKITTLFSDELPEKSDFETGEYMSFLDMDNKSPTAFKTAFRWSNAYLWLVSTLKENGDGMYFGAITEKLHGALVSDPKPYRKDVKQLLANLLSIIETLQMEEIVIDRPNYSQRVRLKENNDTLI